MGSASELTRNQNVEMARGLLQGESHSRLNKIKLREISRILDGVKNKGALADVGCFDGSLTAEYAKRGFTKIDGFDISQEALDKAARVGVNAMMWDFESEPCPSPTGIYDAVVCSDVLEHVFNTQNLINECFRVLKPGGTAVFLVPNLASLYNRYLALGGKMPNGGPGVSVSFKTEAQVNLGHARLGTNREWQGLLANGGFRVKKVLGMWAGRFSRALALSRPGLAHSLIYECTKN